MSLSDLSSNDSSGPMLSTESEEDYGLVNLEANAPYQGEPLAVAGEPAFVFEEDKNRIPHEVLAARSEGRIDVNEWCVFSY